MPQVQTMDTPPPPGASHPLRAWLEALRERRYVARRCRELLALAEELRRAEPALAGLPLYRRVVAEATGADAEGIDRALEQAEHNFASWPVSRPLKLRDVAHHIAVCECFAASPGRQAIRAELKRLVDETIPGDL